MPLHLDSFTDGTPDDALLAWLLQYGIQSAQPAFASADKRYMHWGRDICDEKTGDRIGRFVYTLENDFRKKNLNILDLDIVFFPEKPVPLRFLNRLPMSSNANEYYEVEAAEGQRLEVETVNRHAVHGEIAGTVQAVYTSAFPFAVNLYDSLAAYNERAGFGHEIKVGNAGYTVKGYGETFAAPGGLFGAQEGETFSFLLGRVAAFRDVSVRLGEHTLSFVLAQLDTAVGRLPTAMSREIFDLRGLAAGKFVGMKADIKADFAR